MPETKNLMQSLLDEMNRVREVIKAYEDTPNGEFAATQMRNDIKRAEKAAGIGDVNEMIEMYQRLKTYET